MIILRKQKEYNIVTDLYYSGFPRTYKKVVGNARRNIAKKLSKSSINNMLKNRDLTAKINNSENAINNQELSNNLIKRSKESGVNIEKQNSRNNIGSRFIQKDGKSYILFTPLSGEQNLAHELGHHEVISGKQGKINQKIQRYYYDTVGPDFNTTRKLQNTNYNHGRKGIRNIWKDLRNKIIVLKGEKDATRQGLKILKESGASPEEIQKAKISLQDNLETYKNTTSENLKTTIRNTIQIPSRQMTPLLYDLNKGIKNPDSRKYPVFRRK